MMSQFSSSSKRIAKNTVYLYIRTFVILLVSLYTSRVVLGALGVDDYGTYNVVGGFVAMFSLLSGSLSNAISRYITFELGKDDSNRLKDVFSTSVTVQILIALVIIVLAELIGVWFLNAKMSIPDGRLGAANWVFQCSLLTFCVNLISIPYNACIIAHERMNAFAYVSILEALLKLGAVFLLFIIGYDRLIVYSILLVLVAAIIRLIYGVYCKCHFEECHYRFSFNLELIKEMSSLAGWNMLGSSGAILNTHGINLLMNLFFGVKVNAARGLAVQVNSAVTQFVYSFTTAVSPQITKSYAKGLQEKTFNLVMLSSRFSFFLIALLAVPLFVETPFILRLWLKDVPDYTVLFVRLTLVNAMIMTLSTSLYTLAIATGDIKNYQIVVGSLSISCFFITYVLYRLGSPVEVAYYVSMAVNILILFARIFIVSGLTGISINLFLSLVLKRVLIVSLAVLIGAYSCSFLFPQETLLDAILSVLLSILVVLFSIYFFGLSKSEKSYLLNYIKAKMYWKSK